jgi:sugar (pentulose or hexulose) kinase
MTIASLIRDRRLWLVLGAVALFFVVRWSGLADWLSLEAVRTHREALVSWVTQNLLLAAAAYVLVYVVAVAFSVPGAVFLTLTGGFLFGAALGTALTVVGATTGATLIFLFARTLFGERMLDRLGAPAARLAAAIRRNAWSYLLVLRLVPLFPFFLVNLVPAFVGLGAPHWAPDARGAMIGLTRGVNRPHLCRAALECIAFQSADLVDAIEADSGIRLEEMRVDGGVAKSDPMLQFQADLLQRPVVRPRVTETTALGAAYLAGLATGFWADRDDIRKRWQIERVFEPQRPADEMQALKADWLRAVERSLGWQRMQG